MTKHKITIQLRRNRKVHRVLGISLAILLLISAITGFLLGWKKNIDLLQPPTQKGASKDLADWKPVEELAAIAQAAFMKAYPEKLGYEIDRMDVRPSKGIVKVLLDKGWWEVQVDGSTGAVLSIARRHSDWIEQLHDGSIISDGVKLLSMNILGIGLLVMILSGWYLWYGPKRFRKIKRSRTKANLVESRE